MTPDNRLTYGCESAQAQTMTSVNRQALVSQHSDCRSLFLGLGRTCQQDIVVGSRHVVCQRHVVMSFVWAEMFHHQALMLGVNTKTVNVEPYSLNSLNL